MVVCIINVPRWRLWYVTGLLTIKLTDYHMNSLVLSTIFWCFLLFSGGVSSVLYSSVTCICCDRWWCEYICWTAAFSDTVGVAEESSDILNCAVKGVLNGHLTMDLGKNCPEGRAYEIDGKLSQLANDSPVEKDTDMIGASNQDKNKERWEDITVLLSL